MSLSKSDISAARSEIVRELVEQNRDAVQLLSPAQVCGLLDVNPKTLSVTAIPRVVIVPNKVIRYRLADVARFIETHMEE